jgi:hypothetical protein
MTLTLADANRVIAARSVPRHTRRGHGAPASCVDGALRSSTFWRVTIAVGCSHVSGLLVQPFFTTAGPDVVREMGPDQVHGLDTRDAKKVLPPRRPTDQHHAISTSATRDASRRIPLALALQSCAARSRRSGRRARLGSIVGGAMAGLVDAAVDHDGPGDPRGLVGDRDRRLLGRHAAKQLRDPGEWPGARRPSRR